MSAIAQARYVLEDGFALADALSLRFRARPLVHERASAFAKPWWSLPSLAVPSWSRISVSGKRKFVVTILALGVAAAPLIWSWTLFGNLASLRERMDGIVVYDAAGVEGGVIVRDNGLSTRDANGRAVPMISMPVRTVPKDFMTAAVTLEGEGTLGVSPINLARAAVCWPFQKAGIDAISVLRLEKNRCGGGSTLTAEAVRSITDKREYGIGRKINEAMVAVGLSLHLTPGSEANSRFLADTLQFGYASGLPLYGVRNTARAVFAKDEGDLDLHESALLAGMLLYPVALNCGQSQKSAIARFDQIRNRAIYALDRGFRNDPRYETARANLIRMQRITAPANAPEAVSAGLDSKAACIAGANPALRLEKMASGAKLAALASLGEQAGKVREVRLSINFQTQAFFVAETEAARQHISVDQHGHWQIDPAGGLLTILSFTTDQNGALTTLYESTADLQLNHERELGSLAKIPALLFLAERGWRTQDLFCNKASPPYTNAGGDVGVKECTRGGGGLLSVTEVWSKSVSLAVLDALRRYPGSLLTKRMNELGIALPSNVEPAYALAFGLARATPSRMEAIFAGISAGISSGGSAAIGREPNILGAYRTSDGVWHMPTRVTVDLRSIFSTVEARELISRGAAAAYLPGGTLSALGPVPFGTVGKTGTLDTETRGMVRLKAASGAWGGRGWFTMAVPHHDALGDSSISILPLSRIARDSMMRAFSARSPNSIQPGIRRFGR